MSGLLFEPLVAKILASGFLFCQRFSCNERKFYGRLPKGSMGTIKKALELLDYISTQRPEIGLGEYVRLTQRDKATVHRHLVELAECGFLEQNPETRRYRLGPAILRLYGVREANMPLRSVLRPFIEEMAQEVGELVHVSLLQGQQLSPVVHHDPRLHGTQVAFDESQLLPLHATASGLVMLCFGGDDLRARVLDAPLESFTAQTVVDPDSLREKLAECRANGSVWVEKGFDDEVSSLAGPIFGLGGAVIGAVSIAVPSSRAGADKRKAMVEALRKWVPRLSELMGGSLPADYQQREVSHG
ncbi:IclR family transcriptional regulator [Thioclava sp. F34-6]|uniref:IclR family transcriptional regulator n=1 Tax=Thioclava sp. F34-6 TaxID=1973003 RepID=UPI001F0A36A9|nr:IclR family transcriptional regulator [Thioclava sp. F34-6]